jgi:hypothetical protein
MRGCKKRLRAKARLVLFKDLLRHISDIADDALHLSPLSVAAG